MLRKIIAFPLAVAILFCSQIAFAEKTDWTDRNFYFKGIKDVIVFDMTVSRGLNYGGEIVLRNIQDIFVQNSRKMKCNVITEAQAYRTLGYQLGMNLERMAYSNPLQARQIVMQNAYRIADAWVVANVDNIANTYYIEPERTVWESRTERRKYYDRHGNKREEVYTIQVPVTYPPRRVDVSTLEMTLQLFEARNGQMIFARRDVRDRNDYQAQLGMYGRITNSFFEDIGKKIR